MISPAALLTGLLLALQTPSSGAPGFHPDERLVPPGGPEVAIFRSVPPEIVSIRLSVPLTETVDEAGGGQLLRILARDRMAVLAARIGARSEVHRTPQALVYELTGAAADLDFLGWILREGMRPPTFEAFEGARNELRIELERQSETPQGVLYQRIREALAPGSAPPAGSLGALDRMDVSRLEAIWARSHRRDRLRVVIAARLPTETILATLSGLGLPADAPLPEMPPSPGTGAPRTTPQVIRHWVVDAYRLGPGEEASSLVAARFMAELLRSEAGDFEAGVEIWDVGGTRALAISGAAYPRSRQAMERRLRAVPADAAARLTERDTRRLADELRTEILLAGRTPWGLTELVGQAWDSGQGPEGVEALLDALRTLPNLSVVGLLQTLSAASPIRESVAP